MPALRLYYNTIDYYSCNVTPVFRLWRRRTRTRRLGYATLSSGPALYFWIPTFLMVLMYACAICAHSLW